MSDFVEVVEADIEYRKRKHAALKGTAKPTWYMTEHGSFDDFKTMLDDAVREEDEKLEAAEESEAFSESLARRKRLAWLLGFRRDFLFLYSPEPSNARVRDDAEIKRTAWVRCVDDLMMIDAQVENGGGNGEA